MERASMTPLTASYRSALSTAARDALLKRRRPTTLPGNPVVVRDHVIGEEVVASFGRLFPQGGIPDSSDLPSVLVHIAGFPAAMDLMAEPGFPLPLLGMVHLQNTVTHHRPVPAGVPLQVAASAARLAPHPSGTTVDLVVTVHARDGEPLWEGVSTYLGRGVHLPQHERTVRPEREEFTVPPLTARWALRASTGRDYAAVSGDYNPIHLNPLAARALGQKGMIAHGMYLAGRMLDGREPAGAGHSWGITFAAPVPLPGTVSLRFGHPAPGVTEVTGWNGRKARPHFTGRIELPHAGVSL